MKAKPVPVLPCERETTVTYSVEAVRKHGLAQICTFDPKLKRKVLTSGGRVVREGNTTPPYWCLEVDASKVVVTMRRKSTPRPTPIEAQWPESDASPESPPRYPAPTDLRKIEGEILAEGEARSERRKA